MTTHLATLLVLAGALSTGYVVAGLFFLSFWRDTRDRLFGLFAGALLLLALQRIAPARAMVNQRDTTVYYVRRLAAFLVLLFGIIDENRATSVR